MPTYNPLTDRFLTVATVKTKNGQKDVRVVLDIDTNIFYTLDDDGNFIPIAYSQTNPDVFVSGGTYNNNTFTYTNTTGGTFSVNFDTLTGLTVTGIISATTISGGTLYGDGSNLTNINPFVYPPNSVQHFLASNSTSITTVALVINTLRGYFITLFDAVEIEDLRIRMQTGVSGNSIFGLYNLNSTGYPQTLIYSTTAFDNSLTTQQVYTSPLSISAGTYFVAYNSNSNATAHAFLGGSLHNPASGTQDTISSSCQNSGLIVSYSYVGSLPSTFPNGAIGGGNINHPIVLFKI